MQANNTTFDASAYLADHGNSLCNASFMITDRPGALAYKDGYTLAEMVQILSELPPIYQCTIMVHEAGGDRVHQYADCQALIERANAPTMAT